MCSLSTAVDAWSTLEDWAAIVATQIKHKQPLPILSAYGAGLSLSDAYAVQKMVVAELIAATEIAGYRASLTRPRGQVAFGLREPVTGVLARPELLHTHARLRLRDFKRLTIAPGLGFVLKSAIRAPLSDLSEVAAKIAEVIPVVEFSDLNFEQPAGFGAADFIVANNGFSKIIVGKPLPNADGATINAIFFELLLADAVVDRGRATNVMGSQHTALYWLINRLLAQGWRLEAGALLVTGGFSDPVPAARGTYTARFWDVGDLTFTIE
ncbi:MAG: 2-keto-4-pentenoate hydratase [Gammaproteobacteria bacterium]